MKRLALEGVSFRYPGGPMVLEGVSARFGVPEVVAILGPNGAGKSTLLDILAGLRRPSVGSCTLNGQATDRMDRRSLCREIAHVPQQLPGAVPFSVEEVILTGRTPHGDGQWESPEDHAALEDALERTGLRDFRRRPFVELSGGERQRVLAAAAICQQTPVLLLDEPGAHLDPEREANLWSLLEDLRHDGRLVIVVTHHLAYAARYADRVLLLHQGRMIADGAPAESMKPALLEEVFRVPLDWAKDAEGRVSLRYGR